jgi:hypothetical protein
MSYAQQAKLFAAADLTLMRSLQKTPIVVRIMTKHGCPEYGHITLHFTLNVE